MDKSIIVKLVWLGAVAAIPVAVLALQTPKANVVTTENKRVMTVDKPVAVEVSTGEVQGPKPLDPMKPLEPAPKPKTMWVGGGKIKSKAAVPAAEAPQVQAKDDHSAVPPKDPSKLTASVAPGPGPKAQ